MGQDSRESIEKYHISFVYANVIFNCLLTLSCAFIIGYAFYFYKTTPTFFVEQVQTFFSEKIVFGDFIFNFIQSQKMIDFSFIITKYILPGALIDIAIFATPFLLIQLMIYIFKRVVIKNENAILSIVIVVFLFMSFLFMQSKTFSLFETLLGYNFNFKRTVITIFMVFEFINFCVLIFLLYKMGKIKFRDIFSHATAARFIMFGTIFTMLIFYGIAGGLTYANSKANQFKDFVTIEYKIDMTKITDGMLQVDVPPKVELVGRISGVNIPSQITNVTILQRFGLETIDVGGMVNSFTHPRIDRLIDKYILLPRKEAFVAIGILTVIIFIELICKREFKARPVLFYLQAFITVFLFLEIPNYFPTELFFFIIMIATGAALHIIADLYQRGVFDGIIEKVKEFKEEKIEKD